MGMNIEPGDDEDLSLEASLGAAFDELESGASEPAPKPTKDASRAAAPAETSKETADRGRDQHGRFAAKEAAEASGATRTNSGANGETGSEGANASPRKPPASWAPELHDHWSTLSPAIQDYVLKRETDYSKGIEERSTKLKTYETQLAERSDLEGVLQPYRQQWALNGVSPAQQIQRLFAAQELLNKNPVEGLRWLAEQYRLTPQQIFNAAQNQQFNPGQQIHPVIAQQLAQLKQQQTDLARRHAEWEDQRAAEQTAIVTNDIEGFKADPAHKHFETVKQDMADLLASGKAETLKQAYDRACRLNDDVWDQVVAERNVAKAPSEQNDPKAKAKADAARAAKARSAAVSVRGAPSGVSSRGPMASIEEELNAAWDS